ncbi:helix-turn-helix domain-containing protein [Alsobacter sp. SYSU BS001988]
MLTGAQIRAARALLGWSASDLSRLAGVSVPTIQRLEQHDGLPPGRIQTIAAIQKALESAGVEFIGSAMESPGVRRRINPSVK